MKQREAAVGTEIERKFLVHPDRLPPLPAPRRIRQGYLATEPAVRVRQTIEPDGRETAKLTIKGPGLLSRAELEYAIPPADLPALFALCQRALTKDRFVLGRWELDHFHDLPRGELWLAELELSREDEPFERPAWLGEEVTLDPSYSNSRLAGKIV